MPGELELLKWIRSRVGNRAGRILVDSGDDCAVLRFGREQVLLKVDSVIEGVHFTKRDPLDWVGHKALARPLSDIAAMGGRPVAAVAALMMPRTMRQAQARRIYLGMERLGVPVVGGDVSTHKGALAISVSVLGEMKGLKPVRRRGARPGDVLVATSSRFGGSLRSGRHLRFKPLLEEGRRLAGRYRAHAMIDVSDGLVRDLAHLCEAGGVAAMLVESSLRTTKLEAALYDGEDYELLAALGRREAESAARAGHVAVLGWFWKGRGVYLQRRDGVAQHLDARGYEHAMGV